MADVDPQLLPRQPATQCQKLQVEHSAFAAVRRNCASTFRLVVSISICPSEPRSVGFGLEVDVDLLVGAAFFDRCSLTECPFVGVGGR